MRHMKQAQRSLLDAIALYETEGINPHVSPIRREEAIRNAVNLRRQLRDIIDPDGNSNYPPPCSYPALPSSYPPHLMAYDDPYPR